MSARRPPLLKPLSNRCLKEWALVVAAVRGRKLRRFFLGTIVRPKSRSPATGTGLFIPIISKAVDFPVVVTVAVKGAPFSPILTVAGDTRHTLPTGAPEQESDAVPV